MRDKSSDEAATLSPLFIILTHKWYDAFDRGEKTEEWRRLNSRWNAETCRPGREVILRRGYKLEPSIAGVITRFRIQAMPAGRSGIYPAGTMCAVLTLQLRR